MILVQYAKIEKYQGQGHLKKPSIRSYVVQGQTFKMPRFLQTFFCFSRIDILSRTVKVLFRSGQYVGRGGRLKPPIMRDRPFFRP